MRTTFAVGKLTRTKAEIQVMKAPHPILTGPWLLRALVRDSRASSNEGTVH